MKLLPTLLPQAAQRGLELGAEMRAFEESSAGLFAAQGQGLMWGARLLLLDPGPGSEGRRARLMGGLRRACAACGVLPYFVPGGFMVTPLLDVQAGAVREMGARLRAALSTALAEEPTHTGGL